MIVITAKKDGFRRCGLAHTITPTEYPDDRFTKDELATLQAEKMLVVQVIDDPAEDSDSGKKNKGKKPEVSVEENK